MAKTKATDELTQEQKNETGVVETLGALTIAEKHVGAVEWWKFPKQAFEIRKGLKGIINQLDKIESLAELPQPEAVDDETS